MRVRAADSSETLLKVIKNPIEAHLPVGAPIVGLEAGARLVDASELPTLIAASMAPTAGAATAGAGVVPGAGTAATAKASKAAAKASGASAGASGGVLEGPVVFVIGAMSHGDIDAEYIQQTYSISRYPLSAACAVSKLLNSFEHAWGVL